MMPRLSSACATSISGQVRADGAEIDQDQVVVRPAAHQAITLAHLVLGSALAFFTIWAA